MGEVPNYHQSRLVGFLRDCYFKKKLLLKRFNEKILDEIKKNPDWLDKEVLAMEQDCQFSLNAEKRRKVEFHRTLINLARSQAHFYVQKRWLLNFGPEGTRAERKKLIKNMRIHLRRRNRARWLAIRLSDDFKRESAGDDSMQLDAYLPEKDALDLDYNPDGQNEYDIYAIRVPSPCDTWSMGDSRSEHASPF